MGVARTILRPVAYLAGLDAARQLRRFLSAHQQTRLVQETLLKTLIAHHRETAFGQDHDFPRIHSYEDFKQAVPIGNYETLRPYISRVLEGETAALLPPGDPVLMFSKTSGTTGEPKEIPVTQRFLDHMRRGWNIFGVRVLRDHPEGWLRPILQISSPMRDSPSPMGIPCGAISGLLAATQKRVVRRMYVANPGVESIPDPSARYYTTLRCGIGRDVAIITTANPSTTIRLIEVGQQNHERLIRDVNDGTIRPPGGLPRELAPLLRFKPNPTLARKMEDGIKRDGELLPRHFWDIAFLANWTGGTLKLYLPRLRELFGAVPIRDIGLLASEGRFSIPFKDDTSAGLAEITGNFLEFIPSDRIEEQNPPTMLPDEVEIGGEYFLVITNWAGLWRYNIDDCVRVTDRYGRSPVFEFLSRGLHTANITGEKITEYQVVEAMRRASNSTGRNIERFVLQGRFARQPYYEVRLEAAEGPDVQRLSERMDKALCELNVEYHSKRESGRLGCIRAICLPEGTLGKIETENIRRHGGRSEQYKHRYLLTEVLTEE